MLPIWEAVSNKLFLLITLTVSENLLNLPALYYCDVTCGGFWVMLPIWAAVSNKWSLSEVGQSWLWHTSGIWDKEPFQGCCLKQVVFEIRNPSRVAVSSKWYLRKGALSGLLSQASGIWDKEPFQGCCLKQVVFEKRSPFRAAVSSKWYLR